MRRIYTALAAVVLIASSCQKDLGGGSDKPNIPGTIPADFDWKTTRNVSMSVSAPVVDGTSPDYAVVSVYSSPILSEENLVAKGVAKSAASFRTAFTLPAGVENLYVQTTLPDGMKSVQTASVKDVVSIAAATMKSLDASIPKIRGVVTRAAEDGQVDYTVMPMRSASDFDASKTISSNPAQMSPLGNAEYYIPAGAEITANITLDGVTNINPVLYVAGKLTLDQLPVGRGSLVVLPGGSVSVKELAASAASHKNLIHPAVYVFEKGSFICSVRGNVSSLEIVNKGNFETDGEFNLNGSTKFYNTEGASMEVNNLSLTSTVVFHQRGHLTGEDLKMSDRAAFYVNCCTVFDDIEATNGTINISADAALTAEDVSLGSATANLASGAMFIMDELANSGAKIKGNAQADQKTGVFVIKEKTERGKWWGYDFSGRLEVVYKESLPSEAFSAPAYQVKSQTVVIPASVCNGDLPPVMPDPEPEPEYIEVKGAPYTYCFEDVWPWIGDYDMNDVVVVVSVDRRSNKDTGNVELIRINWELKAAGAANLNAFAIQLDKVSASQVAGVQTTNNTFGRGAFAGSGLEAGSDLAIIPLFNTAQEILGEGTYINTAKGSATPTVKHTTTVTFAQPVAPEAVLESALNAFIVVNQRSSGTFTRDREIHMPGYKPSQFAVVSGNTFLASDPYRYFVTKGDGVKDNYMMWALCIPGEFRYPAERNDIRDVYTYFNTWAASGGAEHMFWYKEEAREDLLY